MRHRLETGTKDTSAMNTKRIAFTLIEMLVVIAVIALLAAVLFPVFSRVRERARETQCLSNLHQLSLATFQYAQDSDDRYPYGGDPSDLNTDSWQGWQGGKYWSAIQQMQANNRTLPNVMAGYVKDRDLWRCPDDNGFDFGGSSENIPLSAHPSCFQAFGMSYVYTTLLALDGQTISNVRAWSLQPHYMEHGPADISLLADHVGHWHGGMEPSEERMNMVMLDGHAISVNRSRANELNNVVFSIPTPGQP